MFTFANIFNILVILHLLSCLDCKHYCISGNCSYIEQNWCKTLSNDPARHCHEYEKTITTDKEKQAILDKLNSRRNKVASGEFRSLPPAENMMKLKWSKELEISAQRWANQCLKHSFPDIKDMCRDLGNLSVGQNIATISGESPGLTPQALVDVWYMELLNVNATVLSHYRPSLEAGYSFYDYFTQLVWADSTKVGCGGVKFKEREKNRTVYRLVCNFSPAGNIRNHSVYATGKPCSRCYSGSCDTTYKALCSTENTTNESVAVEVENTELKPVPTIDVAIQSSNSSNQVENFTHDLNNETAADEEDYIPFDYLSHAHQLNTQPLSTTPSINTCNDVLAIEKFIEILKKKINTDPMLKELLQTTKVPYQRDTSYNDASVAALINRLYSKKLPSTTARTSESEYVNSTLLVDLVEQVIFRKSEPNSRTNALRTEPPIDVNPVWIQAELADVKKNQDFTGHYFFPEDEDNDEETTSEITEMDYEVTMYPISDIVGIEDFKRNRGTRDFIDEILESDPVTESTSTLVFLSPDDINLYKSGQSSMKKFLEEIAEKKSKSFP